MGQGLALVLGSMVTIVASFVGILGIPEPGYPTTAVALGGQSLLWGYAVFGTQLLQVVPAVATIGERAVFENLEDGIIVISDGGLITRTNPAARSYLDIEEGGGTNVASILETMGVSDPADLPTRFQFQGLRYRATATGITNWRGDAIGQTIVIQEVTLLSRRQQRLQVLNRILRHNVRNDMTVVRGLGTRLQQSDTDELTAIGETVTERADGLITISKKAVELNQIFDREITAKPVSLEAVIKDAVSPLAAQHSDATINVDISAGKVSTDAGLLSFVVQEVIANAVQHTGDHPEVLITAEQNSDQFEIAVTDDGPGIPQIELDTITAGEETDLQHASSLGLWTVHWGAQSLGGTVTFDTAENGTTVTVSLPELPPGKTASPSGGADEH
jgi:signal transduction histidine kinase